MQTFSATPRELAASAWRNRALIVALTKREVIGRYRGSFMGLLWSLFNPVLMLFIYTFVFTIVFNARWGANTSGSKSEFALVLFAGLMVFNFFAECLNRAPGLILGNANYVKKVVFPLETLPWVSLSAALFHALVSLLVWLVAYAFLFGIPHPGMLWLPLVIAPLVLLVLGISWFLASLGVYLRDVSQIMGMLTTALMFMSPIFYPATALPEEYRSLLYMNPLTIIIEQTRDVLFWQKTPDLQTLLIYTIVSLCFACAGFAWFQKTRKGFADVL